MKYLNLFSGLFKNISNKNKLIRHIGTETNNTGLVIGVYDSKNSDCCDQELTKAGEHLDEEANGLIKSLLKKQYIPLGKAETYSGLDIQGHSHISLAGLGPREPNKLNLTEQLNEEKENIRVAMAVGARECQDRGATRILIDGVTNPEAAAEGAILGTYIYKSNITTCPKSLPAIELYDCEDINAWMSGEINAEAQNWARFLSHAPPNLKSPEAYAYEVLDRLCKFDIRVDIRTRDWMRIRNMRASLSLASSSCKPPIILEIGYCGGNPTDKCIALIGKGNMFDSGGLFLKPYKGMHEFRADIAGAASVCAAIMAVARKRLPINVRGMVFLYENMISPMGLKPGDVVMSKTGHHIRVSNPDNDCRIAMIDLINFVEYYYPNVIINVGTYTASISHALGTAATGAFVATNEFWNELQRAGLETGDRVWRMPFWEHFRKMNISQPDVDMDNASPVTGGDTCRAAAFVREFMPLEPTNINCCCPERIPLIHLDTFGTGLLSQTEEEVEPYYRKDIKMGRPTRLLTQFIYQRACLLPNKQPPIMDEKFAGKKF